MALEHWERIIIIKRFTNLFEGNPYRRDRVSRRCHMWECKYNEATEQSEDQMIPAALRFRVSAISEGLTATRLPDESRRVRVWASSCSSVA